MKNKNLFFLLIIFVCQVSSGSLIAMKRQGGNRKFVKRVLRRKLKKDDPRGGGRYTPPGTNSDKFIKNNNKRKKIEKKSENPVDERPKPPSQCHVCHDYVAHYNYTLLPCKCGYIHSKCVHMRITRLQNNIFAPEPYRPYSGTIEIKFTCRKCLKSWLSVGEMKNDEIVSLKSDITSLKIVKSIRKSIENSYKLP